MEWWTILLLGFVILMALMSTGIPVAFAFIGLSIIGLLWVSHGTKGLVLFTGSIVESATAFNLIAIPMFFLMGEMLHQAHVIDLIVDTMDKWIGSVRARLLYVTMGAGTVMSTLSGAGIADTALLGTALYPQMKDRGYGRELSLGTIMSAGLLAAIIPPSGLAVLTGSLAHVSIGGLLIAGILPGLMMAMLYVAYIAVRVRLQPDLAPAYTQSGATLTEKLIATFKLAPLVIIFFMVVGFILLGIATPSEAAATGAIGAIIATIIYKRFTWTVLKLALKDTVAIAGMIFLIIAGASALGQTLALTGATQGFLDFIIGLHVPDIVILIALQLAVLFLGLFLDQVSIMLVAIPIFMPTVAQLGFDPIWFWLLFLVNISIGAITPPFGLVLFALKGVVPEATMTDVYRAAVPYVVLDLIALGVLIAVPQIATFLPGLMGP